MGIRSNMAAALIRTSAARIPRSVARTGRMMSGIHDRGASLEDEYFHRREQEMLRKLKRHEGDAPVVPEYFGRKTSFKVNSLETAAEIDALVSEDLVPLLKTEDGF